MNTARYERNWQPTWQQELLLQAALLSGNKAVEAWEKWKSSVDVARLDKDSQRLLPLLYRNLQIHGIETSMMDKLKNAHRLTWYENQMLFHNMAVLLSSFHDAGIQTIILKGAALTLLHYRDYSLRPMADFDVLVPIEEAQDAIQLLMNLHWEPKVKSIVRFAGSYISVTHGCEFENTKGQAIDLHWHVLPSLGHANIDADFWNAAIAITVHGTPTSTLNPTDQLLHVCAHGAICHVVPQIRWAADATMIMKTSQSKIDWDRLMAQAQKGRLILPLSDTLNYLRDALEVDVPIEIMQRLQDMPVFKMDFIEYKIRNRSLKPLAPFVALWSYYKQYEQQSSSVCVLHRLIEFTKMLRDVWELDHLWHVPFYAVFRAIRMIVVIYRDN